jgi:hypothetical protein
MSAAWWGSTFTIDTACGLRRRGEAGSGVLGVAGHSASLKELNLKYVFEIP